MGTPAYADVTITCSGDEDKLSKINKKIITWIEKANSGKLKGSFKGDYSIDILNDGDEVIDLKVGSMRSQNLDWQLERLSDFCESIDGVIEFNTSVWVMSDGPYWTK
jgi:hypothetical protein